ncbi:hypothetical protein NN6n1_41920 [Shinella zoogloeoides]
MGTIIAILGVLQMIGGVLVALSAKSAIHEILGAVSFGMGTIALALAVVIGHLRAISAKAPVVVSPIENQLVDVKNVPAGGWTRQ